MAKSKGKNPFAAQQAGIKALAKVTNKDRNADFKVTQSGLDSIVGNMRTTQNGLGRSLSKVNQRTLDAMGRVAGTSNQRMANQVGSAKNQIANLFGTVIASNPELYRTQERAAVSQTKVNLADTKAGSMLSAGANEAQSIIAQAGETAANAAQYELAQALRYRAKNDAELIAQQRLDLQKTKFDYRMRQQEMKAAADRDWALWKRQQDYMATQAEKAGESQTAAVIGNLGGAVAQGATFLDSQLEANPDMTWDEFRVAYLGEMGGDEQTNAAELAVLNRAWRYVRSNGQDINTAVVTAMSDLYGSMPGYDAAAIGEVLSSGIETSRLQTWANEAQGLTQQDVRATLFNSNMSDAEKEAWGARYGLTPQEMIQVAQWQPDLATYAANPLSTVANAVLGDSVSGRLDDVPVSVILGGGAPSSGGGTQALFGGGSGSNRPYYIPKK